MPVVNDDKRFPEFFGYLKERESIRLRKEEGKPWPWTQDAILQTYKFTNVRRSYDKTSQELKKLYQTHFDRASPEQILLNCGIARYFGTWEFMWALGWQIDFHPDRIKKLAKERLTTRQRVFTGAYVITNQGISRPKEEVVVDCFLSSLWEKAKIIGHYARSPGTWKYVAEVMAPIPGFGGTGFMVKEITLDTMFFPHFWPVPDGQGGSQPYDYMQWTPIGPGARRGLARVYGDQEARTDEKMLKQIRYLVECQVAYWPANWGDLSPTDIQFGLCEFEKYERTRLQEGTPRSKYKRPA